MSFDTTSTDTAARGAAGPSRTERSRSFGSIAEEYDRWRPGPAPEVLDWLLPPAPELAVDLGAGTGALARLLVERVPLVVAVEPDERMRAVLAERVPGARVVEGRGESIPLGDGVADAVLASSSWHWMDPVTTPLEVARVLRQGGVLGVLWSGPDWTSDWFKALRPRTLLARLTTSGVAPTARAGDFLSDVLAGTAGECETNRAHRHELLLPAGSAFRAPERAELRWASPMTADDLVGLLGTFSGVILVEPERRAALAELARLYLRDEVGLSDGATIDVPFRATCWKAVHEPR